MSVLPVLPVLLVTPVQAVRCILTDFSADIISQIVTYVDRSNDLISLREMKVVDSSLVQKEMYSRCCELLKNLQPLVAMDTNCDYVLVYELMTTVLETSDIQRLKTRETPLSEDAKSKLLDNYKKLVTKVTTYAKVSFEASPTLFAGAYKYMDSICSTNIVLASNFLSCGYIIFKVYPETIDTLYDAILVSESTRLLTRLPFYRASKDEQMLEAIIGLFYHSVYLLRPLDTKLIITTMQLGNKLSIILQMAAMSSNRILIKASIAEYARLQGVNHKINMSQVCTILEELEDSISTVQAQKKCLKYIVHCLLTHVDSISDLEVEALTTSVELVLIKEVIKCKLISDPETIVKILLNCVHSSNSQELYVCATYDDEILELLSNSLYRLQPTRAVSDQLIQLLQVLDSIYYAAPKIDPSELTTNILRLIDWSSVYDVPGNNPYSQANSAIHTIVSISSLKLFALIVEKLPKEVCSTMLSEWILPVKQHRGYFTFDSKDKAFAILSIRPDLYREIAKCHLGSKCMEKIIYCTHPDLVTSHGLKYLYYYSNNREVVKLALECNSLDISSIATRLLLASAVAGDKELFELILAKHPTPKDIVEEYLKILDSTLD